MVITNSYDSKWSTLFYCERCNKVFKFENKRNALLVAYKKKCPHCNSTEIIMLDKVFLEIRRKLYNFIQKVERVREYIDKIILKIDQTARLVSRKIIILYFHKNNVISDLMNMFTDIGLVVEGLEEDLNYFITRFRKTIRDMINPKDRYLKLSFIDELLREYDRRINNYARKIKDIANRMLEVKRTINRVLDLIKVIMQRSSVNDMIITDIFFLESVIIVVLYKSIYLIDVVKLNIKKTIPINNLISTYPCKKLLSNGICIEVLGGKRFFLKADTSMANKLIQTILNMRENLIEKYNNFTNNIKSKIRALKPSTRIIRENLFQLKSQVIDEINKLKITVHSILLGDYKNSGAKKESSLSMKSKPIVNALLRDVKSLYEQRLISLEDYMRLKRDLYKQLFKENEGDNGFGDEKE